MAWALFKNGEQITKAHDSKSVVVTEAFERGAMLRGSPDFPGDNSHVTVSLADGYEIKETDD